MKTRLRLLLPCLTCLSLSSGSSLAGAAAHGGPSCRPAVLTYGLQLRGGQEAAPPQPLILRLNSRDGIKRITTPGGHTTLSMLQQIIRTQLHIPPSKQLLSLQPGADQLDMSGEQTLAELGLMQGSMLHLASKVGIDTASADKAARRASSTLRRVSMDVTADKTLLKVALAPAPAASCQFVSIDARAWQNFAAYLVDTEMELMRVALLFGRVAEGDGVQVDVFYELPQEATADGFVLSQTREAAAQLERATQVAVRLGLQLVGGAFAHPPRAHEVTVNELEHIASMQKLLNSTLLDAKQFVTMRVRAVYDHEDLDGDVTAEVYQPTPQGAELLQKRSLLPAVTLGHAALRPELKGEWEVDGEAAQSVEAIYLLSRVHDLKQPYTSPLRVAFPPANRGPQLRKLHVRSYLTKAHESGAPFAETAADFQFLLHAASLLPEDASLALCKAVAAGRGGSTVALQRAEGLLREYAGMPPLEQKKKGRRGS